MIYFNVSLYARLKLFLVDISSQLKNCLKTDIIDGLLWGIPRSEGRRGVYDRVQPRKDDFMADMILRNKSCKTLLFIELRDATNESIFGNIPRYYTD